MRQNIERSLRKGNWFLPGEQTTGGYAGRKVASAFTIAGEESRLQDEHGVAI